MPKSNTYRVEPAPLGDSSYVIYKTEDLATGGGASVEVARFAARTEANAKAIELVRVDRDKGIAAQVYTAPK